MRSYAVTDYAVLFRELAIPRLVGTPNHQRVREILKRELIARGFSVEEHVFSGRPARALLGVPSAVNGTNLIGTRAVGPSGGLVSRTLRLQGSANLDGGPAGGICRVTRRIAGSRPGAASGTRVARRRDGRRAAQSCERQLPRRAR